MDLQRKLGPLPVWAWLSVSGVSLAGFIVWRRRKAAAAAAAAGSSTATGAGAVTGSPQDVQPVAPGTSSYYYDTGAQTSTASPAGTVTQSQLAAQQKLATDIGSISSAYEQFGGLVSQRNEHPTQAKTLTPQITKLQGIIGPLHLAIQQDMLALAGSSASGTSSTAAAGA